MTTEFKLPKTDAEITEAWRRVGALLDTGNEAQAIGEARALVRARCIGNPPRPAARDALTRLDPILHAQRQKAPPALRTPIAPPTAADLDAAAAHEIAAFYAAKRGRGPDVVVRDFDTVVLFVPLADAAREWCIENMPADATAHLRAGYSVPAQIVHGIVVGLEAAGFTVHGDERAEAHGLTRVVSGQDGHGAFTYAVDPKGSKC